VKRLKEDLAVAEPTAVLRELDQRLQVNAPFLGPVLDVGVVLVAPLRVQAAAQPAVEAVVGAGARKRS
jgi:hypothetical protein